ncbi:MAG: phhA [Gammaproteobacteria bacterium]|jgi:phenylalanine-4-hydroxylase|nr:phhA [Gammaproteobacteria bacterium]
MLYKQTSYIAKPVDTTGHAFYTEEENSTWQELFSRQTTIIQGRACEEYLQGLDSLQLPSDRIPQCFEISEVLQATTGWTLEPVPALISFDQFFYLLAHRKFPAATFIRRKEDMNYIQEPDIFHEIFGHCPLLTNPAYAEFTHTYGQLGLKATPEERVMLARLFWFTIEFGLIQTMHGLRAYGGGILSSINETAYCLESDLPERRPFNTMDALSTSYRIDVMQPIYFVLKNFDELYELTHIDLLSLIQQMNPFNEFKPKHPC